MSRANLRHILKLVLEGRPDAVLLEIRDDVVDRLISVIDRFNQDRTQDQFFWLDTVDGRSVIFNLRATQAMHFLWEPTPLPVDSTRYEGPIQVFLRGRDEPIASLSTDAPDELYDFFANLQHGPDVILFPYFQDEDGERLWVNATQVTHVVAPRHLVEEGERLVIAEDGLDQDDKD